MRFEVKRTTSLSAQEKEDLRTLFQEVFGKPKDNFERQFTNNASGYSYHGLMHDLQGQLVGAYSCIPCRYKISTSTTPVIFGLSVDTMVRKSARGNLANLKTLAEKVYKELAADGIPLVFGLPNANIYSFRKRFLKWKDFGELDYHVLPLRPDRIKPWLLPLRPFFLAGSAALNRIASTAKESPAIETENRIRKINDDAFFSYRYGDLHVRENLGHGRFAFHTPSNFGGARVSLIIDVEPLTKSSIESAVACIYNKVKHDVDAIVYIGKLPEQPINLFRLPTGLGPKPVRMAGRILLPGKIDESVFQLDSWRVNLSDFDIG